MLFASVCDYLWMKKYIDITVLLSSVFSYSFQYSYACNTRARGSYKLSQVTHLHEHEDEIEDEFDISFPLNRLPEIHTARDLSQEVVAVLAQ